MFHEAYLRSDDAGVVSTCAALLHAPCLHCVPVSPGKSAAYLLVVVLALVPNGVDRDRAFIFDLEQRDISRIAERHDEFSPIRIVTGRPFGT
jgi:hypothetical protein